MDRWTNGRYSYAIRGRVWPSGMKIRPFESKDAADAVASIYRAAAEEAVEREPNHYRLPPEELAVEHFGQFKTSEKELILVAEEGEVIGFVQILITHGGELEQFSRLVRITAEPVGI